MEAIGAQKDAPLLRQLVDEGLAIRRRKLVHHEASEQAPSIPNAVETLEMVKSLLLKMLGQSNTSLRVGRVNLGLRQETLAQVRANRVTLWEKLAVPALREEGKSHQEIANLLEEYTAEGKDFAYGVAEELRVEALAAEKESADIDLVEEDQPRLAVRALPNGRATAPEATAPVHERQKRAKSANSLLGRKEGDL
jgi:hypothetical protein